MEQILAHLTGDYILQNNWMANKKTQNSLEGYLACFLHVLTYSLPFLLLVDNIYQFIIIFVTHFIIDKYRLAIYWIKLVNWNWSSENFGFPLETPNFLSIWLIIIIDNVLHLIINYLTLTYI